MNIPVLSLALLWSVVPGISQVRSITVGIDVNSPYGISEPWVTIREGLLRLDTIQFVSAQPDRAARTGEIRTKDGRVPDIDALAKAIREIGAGASLRALEATIDGQLDKHGDLFLLRVSGTGQSLPLETATHRIQKNQSLSDSERKALATLVAEWKGKPMAVRITGPIVQRSAAAAGTSTLALQVRHFEFQANNQRKTP